MNMQDYIKQLGIHALVMHMWEWGCITLQVPTVSDRQATESEKMVDAWSLGQTLGFIQFFAEWYLCSADAPVEGLPHPEDKVR